MWEYGDRTFLDLTSPRKIPIPIGKVVAKHPTVERWSGRSLTQRLQPIILLAIGLPSIPNVHGFLEPKPKLGCRLEHAGEAMCQVGRDGTTLL